MPAIVPGFQIDFVHEVSVCHIKYVINKSEENVDVLPSKTI